ncbi:MAG: class I SAM-dependent methyltransferase [Syntrophaceae bacterium]|nr:class I SAM-dependent methyltransferase [Syntrophaceae bacterium]
MGEQFLKTNLGNNLHKVKFEQRQTCPLHKNIENNKSIKLIPFASINDKPTGRTFKILRCSKCGVGLTDPFPTEETVKWLYEGRESLSNFDPIHGTIMDGIKDFFARRDLRKVYSKAGYPKIASVLDFGTGNGRFSIASSKVFPKCKVDAVDFDTYPPPSLVGIKSITYIPLTTFLETSQKYDFILLRHVLEHIHDPLNFLSSLAKRLTSKGILYIEVPNIESASVRYFSQIANALSVPYHLFNFNIPSLQNVISLVGLNYSIKTKGMPFAGCVLAAVLKQDRKPIHQFFGILLHPVQMIMDFIWGKFILAAICKK